MADQDTFGGNSSFNESSIGYSLNGKGHTPDAECVETITKMAKITNPSLLSESHRVVNRLSYLNYDSASESEESDDDEMSATIDNALEGDKDELLLLYVRKFLEMNIEMTRFASILKSKIKDKNDKFIESISDIRTPQIKRNLYKRFYRMYPPYFKDKNHFPCPPNEDVKIKENHGFISSYRLQVRACNQWKLRTRTTLCHYIKKEVIEREEIRLKNLQKQFIGFSDEEKEEFTENIKIQIEELKKKKLSELLEGKDDWEFDWAKISVTGLNSVCSSEECSQYWHLYLKPSINKGPWSNQEDNRLAELVVKYKNENWDQISKELGTNRSPFQIFVHFQVRFYNEPLNKNNWSDRDERKFHVVVKSCTSHGMIDWIKVSRVMKRPVPQLIKKFCLNRHYPKLVKGRFTKEEDMMILSGIQEFGYDSVMLSSLLKHRTTTQILSRYRRLVPDKTMSGPWEIHEDEMLIKLVNKHGFGQWSKIAKQFITRSRTQVRQRYNILKKRIEQNQDFNITDLRRRKSKRSADKSKYCDNIIQRVLKKVELHSYNMSDKDCTNKLRQMNDLKTHIFPKQVKKPYWSEENLLQSQFNDFFQDKCSICKFDRKSDIKDIKKFTEHVTCILAYFKVDKLKMVTKSYIENDDQIDQRTKAVLKELIHDDVLDFQLPQVRQKLLRSAETAINVIGSENKETHDACPSTSMESNEHEVIDYGGNEIKTFSLETIDCPPMKQEDSFVDLKDHWLYSEIECKEMRLSQIIKGNLDEFEFGVFKFIQEKDDLQIKNRIQTNDDPDLNGICRNKAFEYKLPFNISTIIFLRTFILAKLKLKDNLMDKGAVKVIGEEEITLNKNEPFYGLKYTKKFKDKSYVSKIALNLPVSKVLLERAYSFLWFSNMIIKNIELEIKPPKHKNKRELTKIFTRERLKKKSVREVYSQELHSSRKCVYQKKKKIIEDAVPNLKLHI